MIEARALALTLSIILVITADVSPVAAANDSPRFSIAQASLTFNRNYTR
jgi:hypothetical protein